MNKIYKVIWSDARKCYVVVAEIAKNRGKNNVRSIVEHLAAKSAQAVLEMITATHNSAGKALPAVRRRAGYPRTAAQWIVPLFPSAYSVFRPITTGPGWCTGTMWRRITRPAC